LRYSTYSIDKPIDLPPESEEVAGFYGAMLETDHAKDATFNKNFFDDWSKVLKEHPPVWFTACY
jgi:DNA topoisomerase-1